MRFTLKQVLSHTFSLSVLAAAATGLLGADLARAQVGVAGANSPPAGALSQAAVQGVTASGAITLTPGQAQGTPAARGGGDVKDIDIIVRKKPGQKTHAVAVGQGGRFVIANLEPGDYELTVSADAMRKLTGNGQKAEIELTGTNLVGKVDLRRAAEGGISFGVKGNVMAPGPDSRAVQQKGISGN